MTPNPDNAAESWPFPPPEPPAPARSRSAIPRPRPDRGASFIARGDSPACGPRSNRVHGLTLRQNEFCECFVATGNAADAARRAGYCERSARNQGHRLLKDARVLARVRVLQTALADRIDPGLILGRLENLYRRAEQDGGYRSAARILMLMGRLVGLDYRGAALKLLTPGRAPETGARLPSAVETLRAEMAGCNTRR